MNSEQSVRVTGEDVSESEARGQGDLRLVGRVGSGQSVFAEVVTVFVMVVAVKQAEEEG